MSILKHKRNSIFIDEKTKRDIVPGDYVKYYTADFSYGLVISVDVEKDVYVILWTVSPFSDITIQDINPISRQMPKGFKLLVEKDLVNFDTDVHLKIT